MATGWLDWDDQSKVDLYADLILTLLLESRHWALRRVETIRFLDDEIIRLRVSTDYDLRASSLGCIYDQFVAEGSLPAVIVPIALFAKRPLQDFDLSDRSGKPMTLLTRAETNRLSVAILRLAAAGVLGDESKLSRLEPLLEHLVACDESEAASRLADLGSRSDDNSSTGVSSDVDFRFLATTLAHKRLALALLPEDEAKSARGLIKYEYVTALTWDRKRIATLARFGLASTRFLFPLPLLHLARLLQ